MNNDSNAYCERCDVFDHKSGTKQCDQYWLRHVLPRRLNSRALVGRVYKVKTPVVTSKGLTDSIFTPGTIVRLVSYAYSLFGITWTVETLDGLAATSGMTMDGLEKLNALDKLSLIKGGSN